MHDIGIRIAVDIGGTFTDGVAERVSDHRIWAAKSLTTPDDPGDAVATVVRDLLARAGAGAEVQDVIHGTTLVTNALIERRGARTALLVTRGTRDVPDIGRELRYDLYDLWLRKPTPLVPVEDRFEVDERLDASGAVVRPLDEAALARVCDAVAAGEFEAVAVCFLHGYADDAHELRVASALRERAPGLAVSLASQVSREMREFERMSTVAANAYVQPMVARYMGTLGRRLEALGVGAPLKIMISSGGFTSAEAAARVPIALLESGPAGGVLSAVHTARGSATADVLAFDMGGTTAKACVAVDGKPAMTHSFEAARVHRFKRGSGLPILLPSLDLIEIGAGGGSIANISDLGLLTVGPTSAGSEPGPACYDRGGRDATVTDADLCLGFLGAQSFLGGEMVLRADLAAAALDRLAGELGMQRTAVAWGIANIVNENMAAAARVHIAEKGFDPRRFTMVATGGAGPVHAVEVARKLGVTRVLLPVAAGVGSCLGLLAAPARVDRAWSRPARLDEVDWDEVREALAGLREDAAAEIAEATSWPGEIEWEYSVEMRYVGQGHDVEVAFPPAAIDARTQAQLHEAFKRRYVALYGREVPNAQPQCVTWRVSARASLDAPVFRWTAEHDAVAAPRTHRPVYLPVQGDFRDVPVYDRYRLPPGAEIAGPAILEERESTAVVAGPGSIRILEDLTIEIRLEVPPA